MCVVKSILALRVLSAGESWSASGLENQLPRLPATSGRSVGTPSSDLFRRRRVLQEVGTTAEQTLGINRVNVLVIETSWAG